MSDLINPITISSTIIINRFEILGLSVNISEKKAIMHVNLYNNLNLFETINFLEMSGNDYLNWDTDDSYVLTFIENKIYEMYNQN